MDTTSSSVTAVSATRREWLGLALLVVPMLLLSIDLTVLFLALPAISSDLQPSASQSLWIVHAYGFLIAGFLVTMGRLSDRYGPRRLLVIGAASFGLLSAAAAFAPSPELLIAARALMGVAGATLMPSLFSLLRVMFAIERQRRLAIGMMMSAFSVGGLIGPLVGGVLLEWFEWGAVFLINVPPVLVLMILGPLVLPERPERDRGSIDPLSIVLSSVGVLAVVYGLQELTTTVRHSPLLFAFHIAVAAVGVVLITFFIRRQRSLQDPLLDIGIVTHRRVAPALLALALTVLAVVGIFFVFTQHLQWVVGLSALEAGVWSLPYVAVNIVGALLSSALAKVAGVRVAVVAGLSVAVVGLALLLVVGRSDAPVVWIAAAMTLTGFGQGVVSPLLSNRIISSAPIEQAGSAASVQEVAGELGSALGIAVAGAVGTLAYRASMSAALSDRVVPPGADDVMEGLPAGVGAASASSGLLEAVHAAGMMQFQFVGAVAVALLVAAATVSALGLRDSDPIMSREHSQ